MAGRASPARSWRCMRRWRAATAAPRRCRTPPRERRGRPPGANVIILGINAFHGDSSACLVRDGVLVAAAEEERFRRIKHWAGFPSQAIAYCLREARVRLADVQHIAVNQNGGAQRLHKLGYLLAHPPRPGLVLDRLKNRLRRQQTSELLRATFPEADMRSEFHNVEHHLAHLSSAF